MIKIISLIAVIALIIALSIFKFDSKPLPQSFDRSGEELRITVIWHDSKEELNKVFTDEFGKVQNIDREGFAVWADPGKKPYWCKIHTLKPKRIDDNRMTTMGHELTHCVIGTFHPEVK